MVHICAGGGGGGGGGGNIKVVVRCRPFNSRETDRNAQCIVQMKGNQTILSSPGDSKTLKKPNIFAFDRSYWSFDKSDVDYAGQDDLHNDLGRPLLDNAFQGYNNCIFAYGQTGSGKSYSMMGYGTEHGVIPKICRDMFERISDIQQDDTLKCTVEVSYLEIYNERVRDLLNPSTKGNLKVREHPATGPYVEDLAKLVVGSFSEIEHLMDEGNKARTVAATNMNETSSRSHAVFTLTLTQRRLDEDTRLTTEKVAKISLVDLAGSERANSTGATGARLREGAEINRSLSTLGRVIAALADLSTSSKKKKKSAASQVPYRDSVLTWLLKDSLGGNSMTAMIAAISPADINYDETLSTLRYADSAKRIKNHAIVNEDANARMVRELKEELATLRARLSSGSTLEQSYPLGTPLAEQFVSIAQSDGTIKKVSKADIQEQLTQSEKLYSDLNQTWEEKLTKTEEIHKEREAVLEELGISIEKGVVGLHTPKKMPHLVNLSDDPLLAECLVYNLKPGLTTVGNVNSDLSSEIRLNGSRILDEHCTFENIDNRVTVIPQESAAVMVNGKRISSSTRLRSGYRIILGDFHIFRFNHPLEVKAERAEQSLLRNSVTANQGHDILDVVDSDKAVCSVSPRPMHDRHSSNIGSELDWDDSRADSAARVRGREFDWSFARREAAGAILGADQKIAGLTDEELNILFEDIQRARAERQGERYEDDTSSTTSYPIREKYLSTGTMDNLSLDTGLTTPSTPRQGELEGKVQDTRERMQSPFSQEDGEYHQTQHQDVKHSAIEFEEIKKEKERLEESLREAKVEMYKQLEIQKQEFNVAIRQARACRTSCLTEHEVNIASRVFSHWRRQRYVAMMDSIMRNSICLKEAQILSHNMDENIIFQFFILDEGQSLCSSYDMIFTGVTGESSDTCLDDQARPCVAVRVMDYKHNTICLWSLEKFQHHLQNMRQLHQYEDRPEYMQHLSRDNTYSEMNKPQFSLIGDVEVPLAAVFKRRVQDLAVDIVSPYTRNPIGCLKLALEPSSAKAPSHTIRFNVVLHEIQGFPEDEGTDVHAQLSIPGLSDDGGITATQMIKNFEGGTIRFESTHNMSIPMSANEDISLRVSVFAHISSTHLDKLRSWDSMRDREHDTKESGKTTRLAESQFNTEQSHDMLARIQILEISEDGVYEPAEVIQMSSIDKGCFQLHQGLQRRFMIKLSHGSGSSLQWLEMKNAQVGHVTLLDHAGKSSDVSTPASSIPLQIISGSMIKQNPNGTTEATMIGQWDSSLHDSLLLDRATADRCKVKLSLSWDVITENVETPISFDMDLHIQVLPRTFVRQPSYFQTLFGTSHILHSSTAQFIMRLKPVPKLQGFELWRNNTSHEYIKGEENILNWTPRGVSLIHDFMNSRKRRMRLAELEHTKTQMKRQTLSTPVRMLSDLKNDLAAGEVIPYDKQQQRLLRKYLDMWTITMGPATRILLSAYMSPPQDGVSDIPSNVPRIIHSMKQQKKSSTLSKSGHLLIPHEDTTRWVRRYVELRQPYLHVHSLPDGEEVGIVSLRNSRVDLSPKVADFLASPSSSTSGSAASVRSKSISETRKKCIFAIYGENNSWLLCAPSEKEKNAWIWTIDGAYSMDVS